jgi:hypothetical protein
MLDIDSATTEITTGESCWWVEIEAGQFYAEAKVVMDGELKAEMTVMRLNGNVIKDPDLAYQFKELAISAVGEKEGIY